MNWIRVATTLPDDPKVHALAGQLAITLAEAAGLLVFVLLKFPAHAPSGSVRHIPDSMLEDWGKWRGPVGAFAAAFRAICCNKRGVWVAWERHNGSPMKEAEAARLRAARNRKAKSGGTLELDLADVKSSANGSANGSPLRTNERTNGTNSSSRGRAGASTRPPAAYAPGHANLPAARFCSVCGDGVLYFPADGARAVRIHETSCPHHIAPSPEPTGALP